MYVGEEARAPEVPFYSPMLANDLHSEQRSYAVLNWGQIPTPSVHRALTLFYTRFRDLGVGAIEVDYVCFNFGDYPLTSLYTPWGGVRTSVFPELVLAEADGRGRFHTPFDGQMPGRHVNLKDTGGWAAATQNAANPQAFALGLVFGRDGHWANQAALEKGSATRYQRTPTVYGAGDCRHGPRDYTVMAVGNRVDLRPGETFFRRVDYVIGTLSEVTEKARVLESHADYHLL